MRPFVKLPFTLYKNDPNWVPPLIGMQLKNLCKKHGKHLNHQAFLCVSTVYPECHFLVSE